MTWVISRPKAVPEPFWFFENNRPQISQAVESLLRKLLALDLNIWYYLNVEWTSDFLDAVIPYFRNQFFWAPLYLFLAVFLPFHYGRKGWAWSGGFLISFGLADFISASLIKPYIGRLRPCNTPELQDLVHLIVNCGSGLSFPSSHATNHFALATFVAVTLGKPYRWVRWATLFWALLVSYAQVYVGVHFPGDVIAGGILGACIGGITGRVYNRKVGVLPQLRTV